MSSVILFVLAAALAALVAWVIMLGRRISALEDALRGESGPAEVMLRPLLERVEDVESAISASFSRTAVVRYDAFGDTSGSMSHSTALLDSQGYGVVLTTINGRQESRSYAKVVTSGTSDQPISEEESLAIKAAQASSLTPSVPPDARRASRREARGDDTGESEVDARPRSSERTPRPPRTLDAWDDD